MDLRVIRTTALLALLAPALEAQTPQTGFLDRRVSVAGQSHHYQVFVPFSYTASQRWPVILFLNGAGERGDDGLLQTQVGLGAAVRQNAARFPAIIVCLDGDAGASRHRCARASEPRVPSRLGPRVSHGPVHGRQWGVVPRVSLSIPLCGPRPDLRFRYGLLSDGPPVHSGRSRG
jgi:hypothetical protein